MNTEAPLHIEDLKREAWKAYKFVHNDFTAKEKAMGLDKVLAKTLEQEFEEYWTERLKEIL